MGVSPPPPLWVRRLMLEDAAVIVLEWEGGFGCVRNVPTGNNSNEDEQRWGADCIAESFGGPMGEDHRCSPSYASAPVIQTADVSLGRRK